MIEPTVDALLERIQANYIADWACLPTSLQPALQT